MILVEPEQKRAFHKGSYDRREQSNEVGTFPIQFRKIPKMEKNQKGPRACSKGVSGLANLFVVRRGKRVRDLLLISIKFNTFNYTLKLFTECIIAILALIL